MERLDEKLLAKISGANGSGNWEAGGNNHGTVHGNNKSGNNKGGFYASQGVESCNNGILGGMITGSAGFFGGPFIGVAGLALGVAGGALSGNCFKQGNGNGGGSGSNTSNCAEGGCSW